jgi:hypothetical protein
MRKIDNFLPSRPGLDIVVFPKGRRVPLALLWATRGFGVEDRKWLANGAASH